MKTEDILLFVGVGIIAYLIIQQMQGDQTQADYSTDGSTPEDLYSQPMTPDLSYSPDDTSQTETYTVHPTPETYGPALAYHTSDQGLANIQQWEGRRNDVYKDIAGNLTVGVGHLVLVSDGLKFGDVISDAQVDAYFAKDVSNAEQGVYLLVSSPITQGMFDALVDFIFNLGIGRLQTSTLLRLLNSGDYQGAANEFGKWVHAGNAVVSQLVARRSADEALFTA